MTLTIWKSKLQAVDIQEIEVPASAEFLFVHEQHDDIYVWYSCTPLSPKERRKIAIVGTGHPVPEDGHYIGSAVLRGGQLVFHVFAWPT